MNILVVGCGNVGAALCDSLSAQGHDVSVISETPEHFSNLSPDFTGYTTLGVGIDRDVLKKAGIENVDALAAVTSNDNKNLMVVQLAREFFRVPRVFARVTDPDKNAVFTEFGLKTVCPTNLTVEALCGALNSENSASVNIGGHTMVMSEVEVPEDFAGKRVSEVGFEENETLVAIERSDGELTRALLKNAELQRGDKLITVKFTK
ncbi:MAG: TrkA family potassium uptake protein [Ruminococcus sp.]|nr:TrkA family potassium uptake protein [Ruminococcus sp.]MCM1479185.1 TrkA family potassium uptake protein [Muribaculaceae bacterium]